MEPIRVLQVFTILNRGGAETNIMNYYRKIDRTKIQFDFLVHRQEIGAFEDEILNLGGKIFRLPPINPFQLKNYKKQLNLLFDNSNYKIIHGQCSELAYYVYQEAFNRKVPVIIAHSHNTRDNYDFKLLFRLFWKKNMIKYLNAYFSCGQQASVWLFGKEKSKEAFVMKNAIVTNDFIYNEQISTKIKHSLNATNTTNIVATARFSKQKNHAFLIDIFNDLCKINPNVKLFLVGNGPLKLQIENKVKRLNLQNKVIFLGLRSDVNVINQAMNIFIMPSLFEGLPVSLIEAQANGLKCFISERIPKEAILIPENVTTISLTKNSKFWAEQINNFTSFKKSNLNQRIFDSGYDILENAIKLENKYLELLKNHN